MKKEDCKAGMKVWVKPVQQFATVRCAGVEDVHLEWPAGASRHGGSLPPAVGYDDLVAVRFEELERPSGQAPTAHDPEPVPGTALHRAFGEWIERFDPADPATGWHDLWTRFQHLLEDRRRLGHEVQALLPQAQAHVHQSDTLAAYPSNIVGELGLTQARERLVTIRGELYRIKTDAAGYLQRIYDQLTEYKPDEVDEPGPSAAP